MFARSFQPEVRLAGRIAAFAVAASLLLLSRWWAPPVDAASETRAGVTAPQTAPAQTFEGTLLIVWGDPRPGSGAAGETRFMLALPDGRQMTLLMTGQEHGALSYFGKSVVVTGRLAAGPEAVAADPQPETVMVDSIGPGQASPGGADSAAAVSGAKKVIYVLLKFLDDTAVPHPPSFYTNLTNPDTPPAGEVFPATINAFFKKTSANQFSWVADVLGAGGLRAPGGWLTLPQPKSYYANCSFSVSCLNFTRINADSIATAKTVLAGFAAYDTINFVYSNDLDCCAWGGGLTIDGKSFGVTWEPPWGQEASVYSHELGHSLGLPHSGWVYYAYDSPWDVMSGHREAVSTTCGSYFSRNNGGIVNLTCTEPGSGYIAAHKEYLGWIPSANTVIADTISPVTVTLEGGALPLGAGAKMIKICLSGFPCTGVSARYFTVEARVRGGGTTTLYDNAIPGDGIIIHDVRFGRPAISGSCYFNNTSGWAVPVDATPGDYDSVACDAGGRTHPNDALFNAQFTPGQTYTNDTHHFRVDVLSRSGSSFTVTVHAAALVSEMNLDNPAAGTITQAFAVSGWALNRSASSGTGVDAVHVYALPAGGAPATFLGAAAYGIARGDVGNAFGAQFTNCGWSLRAGGLAPGSYTLVAYAHNAATGAFDISQARSIAIQAPVSTPAGNIDTPGPGAVVPQSFQVAGWTLDTGATGGTGVDAVHVYAFPTGGGGPTFLGVATYGFARADLGNVFGSGFTNAGYNLSVSNLALGTYTLVVYSRSTVSGNFSSSARLVTVRAPGNPLMTIDTPADGAASTQPFLLAGWAIDLDSTTGPGVDAVHVWAYPATGSAVFVGTGDLNFARGDIAGIFGAQFTNSGYSVAITSLTPGTYLLAVYAHSTVTGTFNQVRTVTVTVQSRSPLERVATDHRRSQETRRNLPLGKESPDQRVRLFRVRYAVDKAPQKITAAGLPASLANRLALGR